MATPDDPYGQFNFQVKIDGIIVAGFSEVSGLTTDTNIIEYRGGSDNVATVRKLPGLRKYNNIVLKRGWTTQNKLWTWRKSVIDGQTQRKTGCIVLLDESRSPSFPGNFAKAGQASGKVQQSMPKPARWQSRHLKSRAKTS
jgi:phage tail-like protein